MIKTIILLKNQNASAEYENDLNKIFMTSLSVKTTYLSMPAPPALSPRPDPRQGLLLLSCRPGVAWYRFLYNEVGRDLMWVDLNFKSDQALADDLQDPAASVTVLYVDGVPAGYYELYAEADGSIRLAYFGLMPAFRGLGLGSWLLEKAVLDAWSRQPTRFWLHTCELDSPAALPTYLRAGFVITHVETIQQRVDSGSRVG